MESPVRGIRFIHTALLREVDDLERTARQAEDVRSLADRVSFFARVAELHNRGEEVGLFPEVASRIPGTEAQYLEEHVEEQELMRELGGAVQRGDTSSARHLASALRAHLQAHIHRENEVLVPLVEAHFTPAEQGAHIGKMMSVFTPEDLGALLPWMITWLDPDDRLAYVAMLRRAAPPERLAAMLGMLKQRLPDQVRAGMAAEVPELA